MLQEVFRLSQPYLLGLLLDYVTDDDEDDVIPKWRGCLYASLLVLSGLLLIVVNMQAHYSGQLLGMKCRAALSTAVYHKVSASIASTASHRVFTTSCRVVDLLTFVSYLYLCLQVLKIWVSEHQRITTGNIVNLLATDVEQINTV